MYKQNNYSHNLRRKNFNPQRARFRSFDPRTVIGKITNTISAVYEIKNSFSDFPLDKRLTENILSRKFDKPTAIQDQAILEILTGRDVVGIANTGTGKTAAFLIPLINKILLNKESKVLIITPTRELAVQIDKEFQIFSKGLGLYSTVCIGGVSIYGQINKLQMRPRFVIGTPGRLLDLENQKKINFGMFDSIVLDEVDRMLDMGFITSVKQIILKLPKNRQSLFFAATLDEKVKSVMHQFIVNPVMISVKTADASTNVRQDVIDLKGRDKSNVLCNLLRNEEVLKTLIFMRAKRGADKLQTILSKNGFQTAVLHGNKSQSQRQRALEQFTIGRVNILIATDVASRGLDVTDISHVINYDLPESYDTYIHRIGRTGRADKKGIALTFVG
ncbi:MAG: DEAD/DEAH box helicase [bacterium]